MITIYSLHFSPFHFSKYQIMRFIIFVSLVLLLLNACSNQTVSTNLSKKTNKKAIIENLNLNEIKFKTIITQDCSRFKHGKFKSSTDDEYISPTKTIIIERIDNIQTETTEDKTSTYKIEWLSNSRYNIYDLDKYGNPISTNILEINIFEVNGNSYKYVAKLKDHDLYQEGELIKFQ